MLAPRKKNGSCSMFLAASCLLLAPAAFAQSITGSVSLAPQVVLVAGGGSNRPTTTPSPALGASFSSVYGVAVDPFGNEYVVDNGNNLVEKITRANGQITVIAGGGTTVPSTTPTTATSVLLRGPQAIAIDQSGDLYITDDNSLVEKITPSGQLSVLVNSTLVSGVAADWQGDVFYCSNGSTYMFNGTSSSVVDAETGSLAVNGATKDLYIGVYATSSSGHITDYNINTQTTTIIAGNGGTAPSTTPIAADAAYITDPTALAVDGAGDVYIADQTSNGNLIEKLASSNIVLIAGGGASSPSTSPTLATSVHLAGPYGLASAANNDIFVADTLDVEDISAAPPFPATQTGSSAPQQALYVQLAQATALTGITAPPAEGGASEFQIGNITGCDTSGTSTNAANSVCVVSITFSPAYPGPRTGAITLTNGNDIVGAIGIYGEGLAPELSTGPGPLYTIVGGGTAAPNLTPTAAASEQLNQPSSVATDPAGNLYIADTQNNLLEKFNAQSGAVQVIAGGGATAPSTTPTPATSVQLNQPSSVATDPAGNIYLVDGGSHVEKIDLSTMYLSIVACAGSSGSAAPTIAPSPAATALCTPQAVAYGPAEGLYLLDSSAETLDFVSPDGTIKVIAGGGATAPSATPAPAINIQMVAPSAFTIGPKGNIYIADNGNKQILKFDASSGNISTLASESGHVSGMSIDPASDIYLADSASLTVQKISASSLSASPIAGGGTITPSTTQIAATSAMWTALGGIAFDGPGNLYVADKGNNTIERVSPQSATLQFPATDVSATSPTQSVWLSNVGNQQLTLSSLSTVPDFPLSGGSCSVNTTTAQTLDTGSLCSLIYAFAPTTSGVLAEAPTLSDNSLNASTATQAINMVGTAVAIATTTTLTAPASADYGASVTLTATVTSANGSTPTGTVTFSAGATSLGTVTLNGAGVASLTTSAIPGGGDLLTAAYTPSGTFAVSSSTPVSITVAPAATTLTLTTANTPAAYGSPATITANVTTAQGPATSGTVTFLNAGASIGTASVSSSGVATLTLSTLQPGNSITASFAANTDYLAATSANSVSVDVVPAITATSVAMSGPSIITYGTSVTLTATVTTAQGPATSGTVSFLSNGTILGTGAVNTSGIATFTTNTISGASNALAASFAANALYTGSTSTNNLSLQVAPASTTTTLALSTTTAPYLTSITLTATVLSTIGGPVNTGIVTFLNNGASIGKNNIDPSTGTASIITNTIAPGDNLVAVYQANVEYQSSSSTSASVNITPAPTIINFTATQAANAPYGTPITMEALVGSGGVSVSTGTVTFYNGTVALGTVTLSSANVLATLTVNNLAVGTNSLTASYSSGSSEYASIVSTPIDATIVPASTSTTLTANPTTATFGSSVTLSASVTGPSGVPSTPTGTVNFYGNGVLIGSVSTNTSGIAMLSTSALTQNSNPIVARYTGQGPFAASVSAPVNITIASESTSTTLSTSATTATYGTNVAMTATVTAGGQPVKTGTVSFQNNGSMIGSVSLTAAQNGVATFTAASIPVGENSLTASFSTLENYAASSSSDVPLLIVQASTTTTLTASSNSPAAGSNVTLTASVTPSTSGQPSGTVAFSNGTVNVGTAPLVNGVATLSIKTLPSGIDQLQAVYSGDNNFTGSSSSAIQISVTPPGVAVTASSYTFNEQQGGSAANTLSIAPVNGYSGTLQFSCINLPQGATCVFAPTTLTITATSTTQTVSVTINSTAAASVSPTAQQARNGGDTPSPLLAFVLWAPEWLIALLFGRKKDLAGPRTIIVFLLLLVGLGTLMACGGTHQMGTLPVLSTPTGTTTAQILISGTGNYTQTINITLSVQ